MAVEARKSTAITNADATPRIVNSPYLMGGLPRTSVGKSNVVTTDSVGSTFRMARVPSSARVISLGLTNGAGGATGTADVGVYRTAADGGAVVDADRFAAATAMTAAARDREVGPALAADKEKRLWEYLGLAADPGVDYDIVLTLTQVVAANIDVALEVLWTQ